MKKSSARSPGNVLVDLKAVANMAGHGLTLSEIFEELGLPEPLPKSQRVAAELAFKKGRASGIAQVKRAQFQAALDGKTSAQAQVLKRLGVAEEGDSALNSEIEVVREIIDVPDENSTS